MLKKTLIESCGRAGLFVLLLVLQTIFLAMYLVEYSTIDGISSVGLLVLPVLFTWFVIRSCEDQLSKLWLVWGIYALELVVFFVIIFGTEVREKLNKEKFFGPNNLKITLCMTPAIALLLITTASDSRKYGDLVNQLCGEIVLDLFDTIEALAILIGHEDRNDVSSHLNEPLIYTILFIVVVAFLLSPLEMAENKISPTDNKAKKRKRVYFWRMVLEMFLVNFALMIVRLIAWLKFKHEASIFIAKNAIIVVVSIISIMRFKKWCGLGDENDGLKSEN